MKIFIKKGKQWLGRIHRINVILKNMKGIIMKKKKKIIYFLKKLFCDIFPNVAINSFTYWVADIYPWRLVKKRAGWLGFYRPDWMSINCPEWMAVNRKEWMMDHRKEWMNTHYPRNKV
jgi:hypothetical protein